MGFDAHDNAQDVYTQSSEDFSYVGGRGRKDVRLIRVLLGGSPCTYWSIAQKNNREVEASGMGWELFLNYAIALRKFKPDYFLYENNKSMSPAIKEQISTEFGFDPVLINSALVSAQNRQRLYWVGKRNADGTYSKVEVPQPQDRGILLADVLDRLCLTEKGYALTTRCGEGTVLEDTLISPIDTAKDSRYLFRERVPFYGQEEKSRPIVASYANKSPSENSLKSNCFSGKQNKQKFDMVAEPICLNSKSGRGGIDGLQPSLQDRIYSVGGKATAVTAGYHTNIAEPLRIGTIENDAKNAEHDSQQYRVYSTEAKSVTLCGNGGGVGAKTGLYATPCGKNACAPVYEVKDGKITIKGKQYPIKLRDGYYVIRKLTVSECKRLQTVPEWYEFPVSDSQAYKMLGNGWTVEVISHILSCCDGITREPLDVLSMYDGMACGHLALDNLGCTIRNYIATEIDKYAIQTACHNFPDIVQIGDAFQVRDDGWRAPIAEEKKWGGYAQVMIGGW